MSTTAGAFMVATPTEPRIVCPDWCVISRESHLEELEGLEGFVIHHSAEVTLDSGAYVSHTRATFPDGTLDPTDPPLVTVNVPESLTVDQAEELARHIIEAVKAARS